MSEEERSTFFEKHSVAPTARDNERDALKKKIIEDVASQRHLDQSSQRGFNLMSSDDIYQITDKFKQDLLELSTFLLEINLKDICRKTRYSEETVLDIIKYLGTSIAAEETGRVISYSLR